ncbi:MAG: hypothetical protein Q4D07_09045, partial [Selenomonadaceae bacterium]|nr:hypothetical protein [Selenomonadaceae bacterium]
MKLMSNLKKKQICAAIICGLMFTGGQAEAEEPVPDLYGANEPHTVSGVTGYATRNSAEAVVTGADFIVTGSGWPTVYGGYSDSGAAVHDNKVTLNGTEVGYNVYGGYSSGGAVSRNTVIIKGENVIKGTFSDGSGRVCGGYDDGTGGTVSGNTVIVEKDSTLKGFVYGGYGDSSSAKDVSGNNVYIYGTVDGDVYGGKIKNASGSITNNTVTLGKADDTDAKAQVKNLVLNEKGGKTTGGGILNVYNSGHSVGGKLLSNDTDNFKLADGATINFYINAADMTQVPEKVKTMLTVGGPSTLGGVNIRAGVQNAGKICQGDKIVLLHGDGNLVVSPELIKPMKASDGIMKADLNIELSDNFVDLSDYKYAASNGKIIATALSDAEADLGPDSAAKSPVETMAASVSLINAGTDMMAGEAMTGAAQSTAISAAEGSASTLA